ncbi:MAG: hypothetical protein RJA98_3380 [Pseudomonadota bacterium]|jgi:3-phenylpropionate/cinnamic acid dioxygenase small subunit
MSESTVAEAATPASAATASATRIRIGSPIYNEVLEHLYDEACMLDEIRLQDWVATLATDLVYAAPLRQTLPTAQQNASYIRTMQHFHDDYRSIMGRVMRLSGKSAWAEDPPSRTRRLVTNVRVEQGDKPDEYKVRSYLLVTRSRFNFDEYDLISAERHDVLRQVGGGGFKLARREILLDQAVLGTPNLAIFL